MSPPHLASPILGCPVLVCSVGSATVTLPAGDVAEVVRVPGCTRVPHGPASLVGVANLRGAVLPVVSLARLLGQPGAAAPYGPAARVVVLAGAEPVGLLVEAVAALSRDADAQDADAQAIDPHGLLARDFGAHRRRPVVRVATPAATAVCGTGPADLAVIALRLAEQEYAIPLAEVAAIVRIPASPAGLPQMDSAMLGVVSIRGASLPVASLRALLGLPPCAPGPEARILVLHDSQVGVLVDSVGGTLAVPADVIDPVPPVLQRKAGEAAVQGICRLEDGRRLVCLLSASALFRAGVAPPQAPRDTPAPSGPAVPFVVFRLGSEQYGLPAGTVDRVLRHPVLTRLPGAPAFVAGAMNLLGRTIPVIDLGQRFAAAPSGTGSRRVMVVTVAGLQAAFAVDAVTEVLGVPEAALQAAPVFGDGETLFDRIAFERGGQTILLIAAATLLHQAERDMLAAWAPSRHAAS